MLRQKLHSTRDKRKSQNLHERKVQLEQKKTQCSHKKKSARGDRCDQMWNQHGKNLCVITVNKLQALISISEFKESQTSRQSTKTRIILIYSEDIKNIVHICNMCVQGGTMVRRLALYCVCNQEHFMSFDIALVLDKQIQEQVTKSRNKFSKNKKS